MRDVKSPTSGPHRPGLQWLRILQRVLQDNVQSAVSWETLTQPALPSIDEVGPAGCCVLVVDDDPVNLTLACALLTSFGVKPMVAGDGAEAVSLACAVRLDVILMDLQMPVLDGLAATRQIRRVEREHRRARVPVVAYTTAAPALQLLQVAGIDDVLCKPCDGAMLQACIRRWCPDLSAALASRDLAPQEFQAARHGARAPHHQGRGS